MAQTKKKQRRSTKHRGNAAGMIEARGRTGRPLSEDERKAKVRQTASERRQARLDSPPTWTAAANRAAIATLLFAALLLLLFGQSVTSVIAIAGFMFLLYIPMGYYTDLFVYNRRMKQKAKGKG